MINILLASVIGYLIGSVPFALVIGKVFYKTDIREYGSGNLGGTNSGRVLGAKAAIAVTILDVLKATMAMSITYFIAPDAIIFAGFFATLGHCFPVFANFRGGKAVSTAMGFLIGISIFISRQPITDFLMPIALFFIFLYITKTVSLSSMLAISIAAITLWFTQEDYVVPLTFSIIAIIVIVRHKANIKRILNKTESKITWM